MVSCFNDDLLILNLFHIILYRFLDAMENFVILVENIYIRTTKHNTH